jgi:hypothetical protein
MSSPVRVKVYGLSLTKRAYFVWVGVGAALFVVLLSVWLVLFVGAEPPPEGRPEASAWVALWDALRTWMPVILFVAAALEGIEIYFVLRRFRRAEAEQAAATASPSPSVKES